MSDAQQQETVKPEESFEIVSEELPEDSDFHSSRLGSRKKTVFRYENGEEKKEIELPRYVDGRQAWRGLWRIAHGAEEVKFDTAGEEGDLDILEDSLESVAEGLSPEERKGLRNEISRSVEDEEFFYEEEPPLVEQELIHYVSTICNEDAYINSFEADGEALQRVELSEFDEEDDYLEDVTLESGDQRKYTKLGSYSISGESTEIYVTEEVEDSLGSVHEILE